MDGTGGRAARQWPCVLAMPAVGLLVSVPQILASPRVASAFAIALGAVLFVIASVMLGIGIAIAAAAIH